MTLGDGRIRHTVVFTPRHAAGSPEEADFLAAAAGLAAIPGVEAFEILRETSPKNGYRFGISMEFADADGVRRLQRASGPRPLRAGALAPRGRATSSKSTTSRRAC